MELWAWVAVASGFKYQMCALSLAVHARGIAAFGIDAVQRQVSRDRLTDDTMECLIYLSAQLRLSDLLI